VVEADDWRSKAAREERDAARLEGRTPLLARQWAALRRMRDVLHAHPLAGAAFRGGQAEVTGVWQDGETGAWCKLRPDYVGPGAAHLVDYKTTASANPDDFARSAWGLGYFQQAAWYLDGWEALTGERPRAFWLVAQAKAAPHLVTVHTFDEDALAHGRRLNRNALRVFARCLETGRWPGYRKAGADADHAFLISPPRWAAAEIEALATMEQ